jgi:crotonobetainyl-CoA:carnitine CoA-transferase CaiB-like acyl-CoA transferase
MSNRPLPLEGVRVVDLCVVWAGTFATMLLGDLGAEVIKVENPFVWPPMTRGTRARPTQALIDATPAGAGAYPNAEPGPRPWNYNPTFVSLYRNKKSFTVDWRTEEGMEIVGRLIAKSDAVVENNATETLEKLGVTYDWLKRWREDIIMVRMAAYGSSGPYAQARALGVHLESVMGHTLLRGYEDLDPTTATPIFSGDYLAGAQAALAVQMAIWHRENTGQGQLIELSQAENASAMLSQAFMDYSFNGRVAERLGNRSMFGVAPQGVFPCLGGDPADCEDRWVTISIVTDAQWRALCDEMGRGDWASDPGLATAEGRYGRQDELEAGIAAWTVGQDDYAVFHRLQARGIPAAPVLEGSRALQDPHAIARGVYQPQTMLDQVGTFRFVAPFYGMPETPITVRQAPVAFGEHNDYVYRDVIGVSEAEYDRLKARGHVSMEFDASIP